MSATLLSMGSSLRRESTVATSSFELAYPDIVSAVGLTGAATGAAVVVVVVAVVVVVVDEGDGGGAGATLAGVGD